MTSNTTESPARIAVVSDPSGWQVLVSGELDLCSGRELLEVCSVLAAHRVGVVAVDLAGVSFVDPAGWRAVEESLRELATAGRPATVRRSSEPVRRFRALFTKMASAA